MKRIVLAIVGTVAGLVALLSFKTHSGLSSNGVALPQASLPASQAPAPVPPAPGTSAPPNPGGAAGSGDPSASGGPSVAPPTSSGSGAAATRTVAGHAVQTQYGAVQVQVVVSGSQITNVSFLQLTAVDPRSQLINSQAGPVLLQQTLAAQSSQIDGVSGATYTSEGYVQSLQSALDQVGLR